MAAAAPPATSVIRVTHALCRGLASSFEQALQMETPPVPINVAVAIKQHDEYVGLLRELGVTVHELPADEACPDCVFIEDTALVISDSHAIVTRPGAPSRQPETGPVADELRQLGISRVDALTAPATLDGGDVLVLPWAVLVGTSRRTNGEAVAQLRQLLVAAGGPPVYAFSVTAAAAAAPGSDPTLHFKSLLSALDARTLLVADTPVGHALAAQLSAEPGLAAAGIQLAFVPETLASNVLSIGRTVVMQAGCAASEAIIRPLCEARGMALRTLCMSELAKADGALTCCSILFARAAGSVGAGGAQ